MTTPVLRANDTMWAALHIHKRLTSDGMNSAGKEHFSQGYLYKNTHLVGLHNSKRVRTTREVSGDTFSGNDEIAEQD